MTDRCADVEPLHSAWLDGMLGADEEALLAAHLQACDSCRSELDSLARTRTLLRNLPVRRLPGGVRPPETPSRDAPRGRGPGARASRGLRLRRRAGAALALALGLLGGAAFALGGQPAPGERLVSVPVDLFVADHLVHTVGGPVSTPMVVKGRQ